MISPPKSSESADYRRGLGFFLTETPSTAAPKHLFRPLFPRNPLFPRLRSGHQLFQRPSPQKQFPSIQFPSILILVGLISTNTALAVRDLIIAHPSTSSVLRFDGTTGTSKGTFISSGSGGLVSPAQMVLGQDGILYIADAVANVVKKYDSDGNSLGDFTQAGYLTNPISLKFGPDGNLYVLCGGTNRQIHRFDGSTGAHLGIVVNTTATRMNTQSDFIFMPSTNDFLVVNSGALNAVTRFNFSTGAFVSYYINSSGSPSILNSPKSIIIGPDGNYWVTSSAGTNKITRFSITNGAKINDPFLGVVNSSGHQEMQYENGLLFVANGSGNNVIAYDASAYEPALLAKGTTPTTTTATEAKNKKNKIKKFNPARYQKIKFNLRNKKSIKTSSTTSVA